MEYKRKITFFFYIPNNIRDNSIAGNFLTHPYECAHASLCVANAAAFVFLRIPMAPATHTEEFYKNVKDNYSA